MLSLGLFSLPSDFWLLCCMEEYPHLSHGLINLGKDWVGGEKPKNAGNTVCGAGTTHF